MFLNTFHREHILLKLKIKKLLRKINSKNLTAGVFFMHPRTCTSLKQAFDIQARPTGKISFYVLPPTTGILK